MTSRSIIPLLIAFTSSVTAAASTNASRMDAAPLPREENLAMPVGGVKAKAESPIACVPDALSPAERKRHFDELGPMLRGLLNGIREVKDGYEFSFPSDRKTFDLLAEWMIQEQLCCPFFDLSIRLDREGGPLWLHLSGRKGVKEFIRDDFAPWFK